MIIINKNGQYSHEELELINKVICGSLKQNIFHLLSGTKNKFKLVDNWGAERKDVPKGFITEVYNKDDKLIFQSVQCIVES